MASVVTTAFTYTFTEQTTGNPIAGVHPTGSSLVRSAFVSNSSGVISFSNEFDLRAAAGESAIKHGWENYTPLGETQPTGGTSWNFSTSIKSYGIKQFVDWVVVDSSNNTVCDKNDCGRMADGPCFTGITFDTPQSIRYTDFPCGFDGKFMNLSSSPLYYTLKISGYTSADANTLATVKSVPITIPGAGGSHTNTAIRGTWSTITWPAFAGTGACGTGGYKRINGDSVITFDLGNGGSAVGMTTSVTLGYKLNNTTYCAGTSHETAQIMLSNCPEYACDAPTNVLITSSYVEWTVTDITEFTHYRISISGTVDGSNSGLSWSQCKSFSGTTGWQTLTVGGTNTKTLPPIDLSVQQ